MQNASGLDSERFVATGGDGLFVSDDANTRPNLALRRTHLRVRHPGPTDRLRAPGPTSAKS